MCISTNMSNVPTFDEAMEIPYVFANPGNAAAYIDMREAGDMTTDDDMWKARTVSNFFCDVGPAWLHNIRKNVCSYNVQDMIDQVHALVDFSSPTKTNLLEPAFL